MKDITEEVQGSDYKIENESFIPFNTEQENEEEKKPIMSVEDFVGLASNIMSTIRKVPVDQREEWIEKYKSINITLLKLISFDKAIGEMQLSNLDPKLSLIIGLGVLVGSSFLIPVPKPENKYKHTEIKKEKTENKDQESKEEKYTNERVKKLLEEAKKAREKEEGEKKE